MPGESEGTLCESGRVILSSAATDHMLTVLLPVSGPRLIVHGGRETSARVGNIPEVRPRRIEGSLL